jgi:hypothetical protein
MPMAPYVSGDSAGQCHEGSLVAYVHQCQWPLGVVHNSSKWRSYRRNRTAVARKGIVMPVVDEARAKSSAQTTSKCSHLRVFAIGLDFDP